MRPAVLRTVAYASPNNRTSMSRAAPSVMPCFSREDVDGLGDDFTRPQVFHDLIAGVGHCAASVSEFVAVQEGFPSLGEANAGLLIRRERGPDR